MRVILYNPVSGFYTMPLALLAVGSALPEEKYEVVIVDGRLEQNGHQQLVDLIADDPQNVACVGMTVLTGEPIRDAQQASRLLKERFPDLPIVWGGWHPSLFPTETLDESSVDVTVQGQGEETFRELVDAFVEGTGLAPITGICWRDGRTVRRNPPRAMSDMEGLPRHNYTLLDVEAYYRLKGERQLDYISSTGCYFRCAFCADPFVYQRKWTGISPQRIAEELSELHRKYQFNEVAFQDETFFTYRGRVVEMAEEFLRRKTAFTWTATMRADQGERMSEEEWEICARSGLRWLLIGVESGSQEMLDWMTKDITLEQVFHSARMCARFGIRVVFPVIVGFPGESAESIQASLDVAKKLRGMNPNFSTTIFYFKPYPGSAITAEAVQQGYRLPQTLDEWADFDFVNGSSGPWVTPERYRRIERFKFYNRFAGGEDRLLRRPLRWLSQLRCRTDFYGLPIEKRLVELLRPAEGKMN